MSSINQILNSALMESTETDDSAQREATRAANIEAKRLADIDKANQAKREDGKSGGGISTMDQAVQQVKNFDIAHPNAKWAAGSVAALGAGLGAVALAKKLRSKKAAVTSAKQEKK